MGLNIPMGMDVIRLIVLYASCFDLFETPLRQIDVASTEIASKSSMLKTESCREGANLGSVSRSNIINDFYLPVVLIVTNGSVSVTRNLPVGLRDWSSNSVRMQVAASLSVDQTNHITITNESKVSFGIIVGLCAIWINEPIVVSVFVVVARNLLLSRTFRVGLDVGMKKATSVSHVLDRDLGSNCNFQRTILSDAGTLQIGLKKRAHLSVTGTRAFKNQEVEVKRKQVHEQWDDNKADDASHEVLSENGLVTISNNSCTSAQLWG